MDIIINVLVFAYSLGVFGSIISTYSLMCRFRTWSIDRVVAFTLSSFIPVLNYYVMLIGFEYYAKYMAEETV